MKIIYPKEYKKIKKFLKRDKNAKSFSFYFKKNIKIDKTYYSFLKNFSFLNNHSDVRICMHFHPKENQHDMIILQGKNSNFYPHKHLHKGDTVHVIQGKLGVYIYSENGRVVSKNILKKDEIFRTKKNEYHLVFPVSQFVIYHENKKGPFLKNRDSIFAKWPINIEKFKKIKNY